MAESQPPRREARIVAWLQRANAQSAAVLRWVAIGGIIFATAQGRADLVSAFIGLAVLPSVVGKPRE